MNGMKIKNGYAFSILTLMITLMFKNAFTEFHIN